MVVQSADVLRRLVEDEGYRLAYDSKKGRFYVRNLKTGRIEIISRDLENLARMYYERQKAERRLRGEGFKEHEPKREELVDREFVRKIESMRRDPKLPVIAREIDDYAWWRRVCVDLGIMVFFKLSPLANLTVEERESAEAALNKLVSVFNDMFDKASRFVEVEAENRRLKEELQQVKAELERWREYGREMEEWLDRFIEQARRYEVVLSEIGE